MTTPPVVFVDLPRMASCGPISRLRKTFIRWGALILIVSSSCLRRRSLIASRTKGLVAETNYLTFLVRLFVVYAARSCASLACKDGGARTDPRIYHLRVGGLS